MSAAVLHLLTLIGALLIDRLVGDPQWLWRRLPHPVAVIGRVIAVLELRLNNPALSCAARRRRGAASIALLILAGAAAGLLIERLLWRAPFAPAIEAVLVAVLLAQKALVDHVSAVARRLGEEGLAGGRDAVALIVGRDVSVLDEAGVARAAIESAAENFSDGLVAPAFWYLVLGLPGILVYKIVNTADSMIGHPSPRYEAFGWASARLDDLLNLVPARLAAALIGAAAAFAGGRPRDAWRTAWRDARRHKSPNAGWPEAAAAGALGLALGGPRRYGDLVVDGAWLHGFGRRDANPADIRAALRLIDAAWLILVLLLLLAAVTALWIGR